MSNEINYNLQLNYANGFASDTVKTGTLYADQTSTIAIGGIQNIATSPEAFAMGEVSSAGFAFFRNLGPTNYVDIGTGTGTSFSAFVKLKAGEAAILRLATNAPTGRSNTAAVNVQYKILSD